MATVASGLNSGSGFNSSDTITSTTLNNHVNDATVTNILTADIASSTNKTSGVTFEKMQHISTEKVLARTSAGEGDVEEIDIAGASGILLDEDTMSSDSATRGATQQSIKAYVNSQAIGVGQSWTNQFGSRSNNVAYQNTTGRPIQVAISHSPTGNSTQLIQVSADNSTYINICELGFDASESASCFIVPNNHYYKSVGSLPLRTWSELR